MYKLYWAPGCGSFAPHVALNEVGAQHELIEVDLEANQHLTPDFLAVNPRAQVPALTLPDGTVMTESVAMMMHIADCHPRFGLMPPVGTAQRAEAYRWLVFCAVNLYEAGCRVSHPGYYTADPSGHRGVQEKSLNDLNDYWAMVNEAIDGGPFLFGETYTVVDICLLMIAQWHPDTDGLMRRLPKLASLCDTVRKRPSIAAIWDSNFP